MPLRTVRSPKALWYFVCRVSLIVCRAYTSFCRCSGDIVVSFSGDVLGVLLGGAVPKIVLIVL